MASKLTKKGMGTTNPIFQLELGHTEAGSVRLHFFPRPPLRSFFDHERELAAVIYALAAELERRAGLSRARWVISPDPSNRRLDIEIVEDGEFDEAQDFLMTALIELGLDELAIR